MKNKCSSKILRLELSKPTTYIFVFTVYTHEMNVPYTICNMTFNSLLLAVEFCVAFYGLVKNPNDNNANKVTVYY